MPLNWMNKTEKGPISSFIIERLSEIQTVHQYIPGKANSIADSCSRFPMLGPRTLETRGFANSVREVLQRLPVTFKDARVVHFHGAKQGTELRSCLKVWFNHVSSLTPVTPPRTGLPPAADIAILTPRCEIAPVVLAWYLLSAVPFVLLLPVDLVDMARRPGIFPDAPHEEISNRLEAAGKLVILQAQMTWVLGNVPACRPVEIFANQLRTPAPITGFQKPMPGASGPVVDDVEFVEGTVPRTLEAWVHGQTSDQDFTAMLDDVEDKALKQDLWIRATPHDNPTIIVPRSYQEILVRDTHHRMFHLAHAKIFALLRRSYYWKSMKTDVRKILEDCPPMRIEQGPSEHGSRFILCCSCPRPALQMVHGFSGTRHGSHRRDRGLGHD
jgi:hypothetical protein